MGLPVIAGTDALCDWLRNSAADKNQAFRTLIANVPACDAWATFNYA
jgi:hypothetical protein